jgi:cytochrome c oxidase subunit III
MDEALRSGLRAVVPVKRSRRAPDIMSGSQGIWWLIATEGALFAYLLFSYFYSMLYADGAWPPEGPPALTLALPNTLALLASSGLVWLGEQGIRRGQRRMLFWCLVGTAVLGAIFVGVQLIEWSQKPFGIATHLYGSLYFVITGFHMAHVAAGLVMLAALAAWTAAGRIGVEQRERVSIAALYWHFVDAVWLAVFATFYLVPLAG